MGIFLKSRIITSMANGKQITNKSIVKTETVIEIIYVQLLLQTPESKIQPQIFLRAFTMDHFLMPLILDF